jgi:hypothetical protein
MSWAHVDDKLFSHPKTIRAGNEAMGVWVRALSYCQAYLTDGFVPREVVIGICGGTDAAERNASRLVSVQLWVTAMDGGWQFHDYTDWQLSKEKFMSFQERKRIEKQKQRDKTIHGEDGRFMSPPLSPPPSPETSAETLLPCLPVPLPLPLPLPLPKPLPLPRDSDARAHVGEFSEVPTRNEHPPGSLKNGKADPVLAVFLALDQARKRVMPTARALALTPSNLKLIAARIAEGYSQADCLHVIAICEAETRNDAKQGRWFTPTTPFRPENFARKLGSTLEAVEAEKKSKPKGPSAVHRPLVTKEIKL